MSSARCWEEWEQHDPRCPHQTATPETTEGTAEEKFGLYFVPLLPGPAQGVA